MQPCILCERKFTKRGYSTHRIGRHHLKTGKNRRRCLEDSELIERGWTQLDDGTWRTSAESPRTSPGRGAGAPNRPVLGSSARAAS